MNNKYFFGVGLVLMLISVFAFNFVSAATTSTSSMGGGAALVDGVSKAFQFVIDSLGPVAGFLFGSASATGDNAFISWMAFLLTLLVIGGVLDTMAIFGDKRGINWAISVIIAWIGVRFVPIDMLKAFTSPAEGLVGAIFLIVPFVIVATLITRGTTSNSLRRVLWVIYAVVMTFLVFKNWSEAGFWSYFYWIYVAIIVACILAFAFDGTLQRFMGKARGERAIQTTSNIERDRIIEEISSQKRALVLAIKAKNAADVTRIRGEISALETALKSI